MRHVVHNWMGILWVNVVKSYGKIQTFWTAYQGENPLCDATESKIEMSLSILVASIRCSHLVTVKGKKELM